MIERNQRYNLLNLLNNKSRNVIIIEGARQVGKSTLVNEILKTWGNACCLNLEIDLIARKEIDKTQDFSELELFLNTNYGFKDEKGAVLFIDEAQESEQLGRYVRQFKENWSFAKVILSGSSMSRLFREDQRIPVGRYTTILVQPLSFLEFLKAGNKQMLLEQIANFSSSPFTSNIPEYAHQLLLQELDIYLQIGGLPAVVVDYFNQEDWKQTRRQILISQEEDFIRKSGIQNKSLFEAAFRGIVNNLGFPSKFTHLSDKISEAKKISNLLKAWKLIIEVEQKGNSTTSSFYPKRYIYDIGISHDLRNHPFPNISILNTLSSSLRAPLGGLIENALVNQLDSSVINIGISGWRSSSDENKEVDFVIKENPGVVYPIECKASLKFYKRHFYGVREYLKVSNLNTGFVVTLAPFNLTVEDRLDIKSKNKLNLVNLPLYLTGTNIFRKIIEATNT